VTDANGQLGADGSFFYFVSTKSADSAQVRFSNGSVAGDTLPLITRGGTPSKLVFINPPASATAGTWTVNQFTVERRDDFDNPTYESVTNVSLLLGTGQSATHSNDGMVYYFTNPIDQSTHINTMTFNIGTTRMNFSFFDTMSSTPIGEDNRLGTWQLRVEGSPLTPAVDEFLVNPGPTATLGFDNPKRTIEAGKILYQGQVSEFNVELWDSFQNPTLATESIKVMLTSTRTASPTNDAYGFVLSSSVASLPGLLTNTTDSLVIASGTYITKLYYFDTRSSESYGILASSRPIIAGAATDHSWQTGDHFVTIAPTFDLQNRIAILSPPETLIAGTTSPVRQMQLQDKYSNPTPVILGSEDSAGQGIGFRLKSDSTGHYAFAAPSSATFSTGDGIAHLAVGQHTTSYFMTDTLAGLHQHSITEALASARGWTIAVQTYTVIAAGPDHLTFSTPVRKLIAGTTTTYVVGISSPNIRIQMQDVYNNVASSDTTQVVDVFSDSPLGKGSVTPTDLSSFSSIYGSNGLTLSFGPGVTERDMYYFDRTVGFPGLSAVHQLGLIRPATQYAVITPNKTTHLTLQHPYSFATPLSVRNEGVVQLLARDQFENIADGGRTLGENNGLVYSGIVQLTQSGSTNTVTLSGDAVGVSTLTLTATATAIFTISDVIQENLTLWATDYANPLITGRTGLPPSDGPVVTTGLVGTPTDMAPEPSSPQRTAEGKDPSIAEAISQGDGVTADHPNAIPMLKLRVEVKPSGVNTYSVWKGLRVAKLGTIPDSDVVEVALWRDMGFKDGAFDPTTDGDGINIGLPIATGTFHNVSGSDICDLDFGASTQTINTTFQQYFITVRVSTLATVGTTFGVGLLDSSAFTIPAALSTARIAENNFPMKSYMSPIIKTPAPVMMQATDIAAYYSNQQNATVPQGQTAVGFERIGLWTQSFTGILDKIKVTRTGTAADADVSNIRVYYDGLNGTDGDGNFQPGSDTLINSTVVQFSTSAALLDIEPKMLIDGTTKYLFIVMGLADSAQIGTTLGMRIASRTDIQLSDGVMVDALQDPSTASFPVKSGTPQITATVDHLQVNPIAIAPAAATQGDTDVPLVRLDMNASDHTVILQSIRISRKNANQVNLPQDVSDMRVYYDLNGDKTLDKTVDQLVSLSNKPIVFKTSTLKFAISDVATNIDVQDISDFPAAPGRLVLSDNTPDREVVIYNGIDAANNEFTNVVRGAEGTTPVPHPSDATVDGQAQIPIVGPLNGQEILGNLKFRPATVLAADLDLSTGPIILNVGDTTEFPPVGTLQINGEVSITYTGKTPTTLTGVTRGLPVAHLTGEPVLGAQRNKSYFIVYDIDPLATPGRLVQQQTALGLDIPTTSYVTVQAPDLIDPIPSFNAEIGDILEYGDKVTAIATNTVLGNTLQQQSVNQPVMQLTLATDKSEAFWTGLQVTSTGTANPADVTRISVWRDADNNGVFAPSNDVMVGSATFGNTGNPKIAAISFNAEQKLVTTARSLSQNISQRYFVTVDMESLATPETTLGFSVTGPSAFSMTPTPPNFDTVVSTGLPYTTKMRTIIPSPRIVTVVPTMLQSNLQGVTATPVLDVDVSSIATSIPIRPDTLGLPTSGYAVLDSEVMFYTSKSNGFLLGAQRGLLGTVGQSHVSGSKVGIYYTQGDLNNAFMKLLVSCNGFNVRWFSLKINRFLPPGSIKGNDGDVTRIRIWKDNGNGILDRDPVTGTIPDGTEILVGEKALATNGDPGGTAIISLNDPTISSPGFALITSQQTTYWVTVDVDPTALFDDLLGLRIQSENSLIIGALAPSDGIHSVSSANMPIQSAATVIRPTLDLMKIFIEDIAPPQVSQAQKYIPMARINLKTNHNTAVWSALKVDLTSDSGAVNGDIASIKLFEDVNDDGVFNVDETSTDANGILVHLMSQGTETFQDKTTTLKLKPQVITSEIVKPSGKNYFLTYDINAFAQVGVNVGALIATTDYFTVDYPDFPGFVSLTPPFNSSRSNIVEAQDTVMLSVHDSARDISLTGGTYQAATNVEVMRFTLTTSLSEAEWTGLRVERIGSSPTQGFSAFGHNSDVKYVKIYRDSNFNDVLDAGDELLSSATTQFSQVDENDHIVSIPLTTPILLSPTARSFFLSYDIGDNAEAAASVGAKIADLSWVTVSNPNTVAPTVKQIGSDTVGSYPFQTSPIPINAIKVSMTGATLSPAQIPQLSTGVPVMLMSINTDRYHATLKQIKFTQTGTIEAGPYPKGTGDISKISIWLDDGNSIFEPIKDTFLGSVLNDGTTNFMNGTAYLKVNGDDGQFIDTTPRNLFVTVDVGATSGSSSTKGDLFGLKIASFAAIGFIPVTIGADVSLSNFSSFITNQTKILDAGSALVPAVNLLPVVWADPFGDGYPALDVNGVPQARTFDSDGKPIVDVDGDGVNDIVLDAATGRPGIDLDGDGLVEVDILHNGKLAVDFNNDNIPDCVMPDQNGDDVPEIDLSCDSNPDFGYIPEKWAKDTSHLYAKWGKVNSASFESYEVGIGYNNMSNGITGPMFNPNQAGWINTAKDNFADLTNLQLQAASVTTLLQAIDITDTPPFERQLADTSNLTPSGGQIQIGSEIFSYKGISGNVLFIDGRGEAFGVARQKHVIGDQVTNQAYVVRARAVTGVGAQALGGAESAVKVFRIDLSPPSVPSQPLSDEDQTHTPSKNGVYTITWNAAKDPESGVRAYEVQERKDNDPVWSTIRLVSAGFATQSKISMAIGNKDTPANMPRETGHFYTYRVRAVNQAGGTSAWSAESTAAATGLPSESITKVTNYPNPVDTRQGPTHISYILNSASSVKITLFDLLGYQIRTWQFSAGENGGKLGPNVFEWDGLDDSGRHVSAGGYIMRIEVVGDKGSTVVLRKIGIIY
jgi:hypothetical protein